MHFCQLFHWVVYFDKPQTAKLNYIYRQEAMESFAFHDKVISKALKFCKSAASCTSFQCFSFHDEIISKALKFW